MEENLREPAKYGDLLPCSRAVDMKKGGLSVAFNAS